MSSYFLLLPLLLPLAGSLAVYLMPKISPRARRNIAAGCILTTSILTWVLLILTDGSPAVLIRFMDGINISLALDGVGRVFAALCATMWPFAAFYAFEYMRDEERQTMFYAFFTLSMSVTLGISFSANMLTMYFFYEMLTLVTIPLVAHEMTKRAVAAAKKYMVYSIGGAAFALIGIIYLIHNHVSTDFVYGGFVSGIPAEELPLAYLMYVVAFIGFGAKAALFPLHSWLPAATVAPTPVTALLHAIAVVKAGAFAIIRLTYYCYGMSVLRGTWAQTTVMLLAAFTIVFGSTMALRQPHFKKRLAYSTVANLSYIIFGVTVMTDASLSASLLHFWFHSIIKIGAFFAAGAVLHSTRREYIWELDGLGRKMPVTFACFTVFALALTGIPPLNGFSSKFYLATTALSSGNPYATIGVCALLLSALLTAIYMLTVVVRAYFPSKNADLSAISDVREVNAWMLVPMMICAAASVLSGLFATDIYDLLTKVVIGA